MRVCVCVIVCVPAPPTRLTCQPTMDNGHALFWHTPPLCHRPKLSATHFLTDFCVLLLVARPLTIRTECACVWTSMCVCVCVQYHISQYHSASVPVYVCIACTICGFNYAPRTHNAQWESPALPTDWNNRNVWAAVRIPCNVDTHMGYSRSTTVICTIPLSIQLCSNLLVDSATIYRVFMQLPQYVCSLDNFGIFGLLD